MSVFQKEKEKQDQWSTNVQNAELKLNMSLLQVFSETLIC